MFVTKHSPQIFGPVLCSEPLLVDLVQTQVD